MAYDKQAIDAARKSGMLGSSMDAAALSLDDEEKAALRRKLESTADEPEQDQDEEKSGRGENIYERLKRREAEEAATGEESGSGGFAGLLSKIVAFFKSLFSNVSKETITRKKAFRELERALQDFPIPVYDPKMTTVRKTFIEYLALVQKKVESFSEFFSANFIVSADDFVSDRSPCFVRFVIETQLSMEQARMLRELRTFDLQRSFSVRGEDITQRDTELLIKKFVDSFDGANLQRMEETLDFYVSLLNLRNYNFQGIFSLFQVDGAKDGVFRDFSLEHCLGQLRNFDSYLAGINFSKLREDHYVWFDRFRESIDGGMEISVPRYLSEDFRTMIGPLRKLCEKFVVSTLVRIGSEDLEYKPKPVVNTLSWVEKYRRLAESSFKDHLERNIILLREEQTSTQVGDLFEGYRPFTWLPLLNRDTNDRLKRAGGPQFSSVFLFNLVWNYLDRVYVERYKRSVNSVVVEGEFRKKELAADFANTYYALDDFYERMRQTLERLTPESSIAIRINSYVEGKMENPIAAKKFESDLEDLDEELAEMAEHAGVQLMKMHRHMDAILRDFKGLRAIDLINAKAIGGVSNRNLMFVYDKLVVSFKKLEAILGRFIVVREQVPGSGVPQA